MSKVLLGAIIGAVLGTLVTWTLVTQSPAVTRAENGNLESIKGKFQQIYDEDFQDYLQLKKHREKYLKANDILGKMMVLFLAELGLRINSSDIEKFKENLEIANAEELSPQSAASAKQECWYQGARESLFSGTNARR